MKDESIDTYLASSLVNHFIPENKSQFKLIKDHNSIRMSDFFDKYKCSSYSIKRYVKFWRFSKSFLKGGYLLKTMTNYKFNATLSNLQHQKPIFEFGREMNFDTKRTRQKSPRDESMAILLNSSAIMASRNSTIILSPILKKYVID